LRFYSRGLAGRLAGRLKTLHIIGQDLAGSVVVRLGQSIGLLPSLRRVLHLFLEKVKVSQTHGDHVDDKRGLAKGFLLAPEFLEENDIVMHLLWESDQDLDDLILYVIFAGKFPEFVTFDTDALDDTLALENPQIVADLREGIIDAALHLQERSENFRRSAGMFGR